MAALVGAMAISYAYGLFPYGNGPVREVRQPRDLLEDLEMAMQTATPLLLDSKAAINLAADPVALKKIKHILRPVAPVLVLVVVDRPTGRPEPGTIDWAPVGVAICGHLGVILGSS